MISAPMATTYLAQYAPLAAKASGRDASGLMLTYLSRERCHDCIFRTARITRDETHGTIRVNAEETPMYAADTVAIAMMVAIGMDLAGFLASSPACVSWKGHHTWVLAGDVGYKELTVAMLSKPT